MSDIEAVQSQQSVFESFDKLTKRPEIKKQVTKQGKIASLANSDSWKALQEVIDDYIKSIENINIDPVKDTVEAVGFRYLASRATIEYLRDIRNLPERYKALLKDEE